MEENQNENQNSNENQSVNQTQNTNPAQNQNVNQTQYTNPNQGQNKSNALMVIIIILVIIIAAGGTYAFMTINNLQNNNGNNQATVENVTAGENVTSESGMTENTTNNSNETYGNTTEENATTNEVITDTSSEGAKASTLENPLKLGEWGLASKYVSKYLSEKYSNTDYTDVPVRVTKVTRGDEATKIVKDWCNGQSFYKYQDPKANTEWTVIDYEVDLSKLTFDEGTIGTSIDVSTAVKGLDGGSVKYNDITYILTTTNTSSREYAKKPGIYKGQFIVTLPQGCKDYVVVLGSKYNGTESYFKCE